MSQAIGCGEVESLWVELKRQWRESDISVVYRPQAAVILGKASEWNLELQGIKLWL